VVHGPRNADAARLGQGFEVGRNVHGVAIEVVVLNDHVTEVDPDAELEALFSRKIGVALDHRLLPLDGAANRLDRAGKLDQQPITGGLDDPAVVPGDAGLDQFPPAGPQPGEGAFFVGTRQARIAGDVGRQDRDELAFDLLRRCSLRPQRSLSLKRGELYHGVKGCGEAGAARG
jgi:hypothetical protein